MAELGFNVGQSLAEGAKGMQEFQETVAAPQALKQAFAGISAEDRQDPQKQMAALMQAGTSLMSQGKGKAGYEMLKEASALKTASQAQQLNEMKVKTEQLDYAGQLMQGAQTEDDLRGVIDSVVTDSAAKMQVESIMRNPNVPFEQKKKSLVDMSMTAKENLTSQLNASKAALDAANKESQIEKRKADEVAKERDQALNREKEKRQEETQSFKEKEQTESGKRNQQKLDLLISRTGSQDLNRSEKLALEKAKALGIESLTNKEKTLLGVGDKGTAAPSSKTKASAREARYADTVAIAGNEAANSIHNIVNMPITVSGGMFAGKSKTTWFNAPIESLKNTVTDSDVQRYNTEIDNVGKYYAKMISGGTATSKGDADQFTEQFRIKAGDSEAAKLTKLAQMRQTFERAAEIKINSRSTPEEQKDLWKDWIDQVRKDVPITVNDINAIENARKSGKGKTLISEVMKESSKKAGKEESSKPKTAAEEAAKAGF